MKLAVVAAAVSVLAIASSARAGVFVGLGVGTGPDLKFSGGELDSLERTHRLEIGYAIPVLTGHLAIEGAYTGLTVARNGAPQTAANQYDGSTMWLAARYNLPLDKGFEVFGRLGLERTSIDRNDSGSSYAGTGPVIGGGAEYHLPWKLGVDLSVWIDVNYEKASLAQQVAGHPDLGDATYRTGTLGVSVGF